MKRNNKKCADHRVTCSGKIRTLKLFKCFAAYQLIFWLLGVLCLLIVFGYSGISILVAYPSSALSGILMAAASLLATMLLFRFKANNFLQDQPYPYFIFGFYAGNLSILILFILDAFINNYIIWRFPEIFLIFVAPFIELFFSYIFGFAFLAIIPSVSSGLILYWFNKKFNN